MNGNFRSGNFPGGGDFPRTAKFRILKDFKRIIKFRNYLPSENLPLKYRFSQAAVRRIFFKIGVLKNFATPVLALAGLFFQETYGCCF